MHLTLFMRAISHKLEFSVLVPDSSPCWDGVLHKCSESFMLTLSFSFHSHLQAVRLRPIGLVLVISTFCGTPMVQNKRLAQKVSISATHSRDLRFLHHRQCKIQLKHGRYRSLLVVKLVPGH